MCHSCCVLGRMNPLVRERATSRTEDRPLTMGARRAACAWSVARSPAAPDVDGRRLAIVPAERDTAGSAARQRARRASHETRPRGLDGHVGLGETPRAPVIVFRVVAVVPVHALMFHVKLVCVGEGASSCSDCVAVGSDERGARCTSTIVLRPAPGAWGGRAVRTLMRLFHVQQARAWVTRSRRRSVAFRT